MGIFDSSPFLQLASGLVLLTARTPSQVVSPHQPLLLSLGGLSTVNPLVQAPIPSQCPPSPFRFPLHTSIPLWD